MNSCIGKTDIIILRRPQINELNDGKCRYVWSRPHRNYISAGAKSSKFEKIYPKYIQILLGRPVICTTRMHDMLTECSYLLKCDATKVKIINIYVMIFLIIRMYGTHGQTHIYNERGYTTLLWVILSNEPPNVRYWQGQLPRNSHRSPKLHTGKGATIALTANPSCDKIFKLIVSSIRKQPTHVSWQHSFERV